MLILSRKVGEAIAIEGGIVIKVLDIKGKTVQLGVEAPRQVAVRRAEAGAAPGTPGEPARSKK